MESLSLKTELENGVITVTVPTYRNDLQLEEAINIMKEYILISSKDS